MAHALCMLDNEDIPCLVKLTIDKGILQFRKSHYGLDGPGIGSRWEAKFSAPVQTGPGAHTASYTIGTGSLPGVKRPGRGVGHPHPSSAEVKKE
jgi:hypothetical protein